MVNYEKVIFEDPDDTASGEHEETPQGTQDDSNNTPSGKKKLSQKQLDALAKGRARVALNRKKKLADEKKDKKFVEDGIKLKVEQKEQKRNIMRTQKEQEHYNKLMAKKEAEQTKEDEPLPSPPPTDEFKLANFYELREEFLGKCETLEDFEEMSCHLDTITEEDIVDDEKLLNKLNNILVNYNE
tara:strand:- start:170 stop:724 length:555 start_codon:yes stop_codon:yes gene_type:complete